MFETSVVRGQAVAVRGRFSLLTISIIAHSAIILGALAVSVAAVEFPDAAPDEVANAPLIVPITAPPPLGNPNGDAKPQITPPVQKPQQQQTPPVAPSVIPEDVPQLDAPAVTAENGAGGESPGTVPGPVGVPWGVEAGVGDLDAPPATTTVEPLEQKIYEVKGEVNAPVNIHRVEPVYPQALIRAKLPGKAIVRCIIDKNGRVRDPQVIYASMPPFGESVARAVTKWRFTPASLRGNAVECYLDLTVNFGVN